MMSQFRFSVGPWNVHEGADVFGPMVRPSTPFAEKVARFAKIGFQAVQFHDDDVVADIDNRSAAEIDAAVRETRTVLADHGLVAEFVAPRLWESPRTIDGALTSNDPADRRYALDRARRSIDIARALDCDLIGFWFAREGTLCQESKQTADSVMMVIDALNTLLEYDTSIRIFIEPKPNEPIDRSFFPTMGHAMALSSATSDPARVGGLVESAHAVLAGLDPANEMAFAMALGRLFGVHLNDQNSLRYDQDKSFAVENLRSGFNQVRTLVRGDFGSKGEYVGLDVKAMRTQPVERSYRHLENSLRLVELLEAKVAAFDEAQATAMISERDYEALEMYTMEVLLKG
jgi:xylose isomerase